MASKSLLTQVTAARRRTPSARRVRALASRWRSERSAAPVRSDEESGAILVLALVFLVAVSLIVTGLLTFVGTSLSATGSFQNERNVEYALTDAVNLAIQNTRYQFDAGSPTPFLNNPSPELCATYNVPNETVSVDAYCSMVWQPFSANTRVFTYVACPAPAQSVATSAEDCAAQPLLQDIVAFYDYPTGGAASPSPNPTPCTPIQPINGSPGNGSCGETMTQISWQWSPVVPHVNAVSPSSGPTSGGTTVTIQGTGFTSGMTVNFIQQGVTGTSYNAPAVATVLTNPAPGCAVPTCIQVTSPSIIAGTAYFITVATTGGTSQTSPSSSSAFVPTFTYNAVAPTVTGLVGTTAGSTIGNTTITIQGTGFWNASNNPQFPAQVFFCPIAGGPCVAGSVVSISPPPTGSNPPRDTMTALTPAVNSAGAYYVQVEVFNLYSSLVNAPQFTYSVQVPIIISLGSTTGTCPAANGVCSAGPGSQITITGANFLAGTGTCPATTQTCVALYLDNGGNQSGNPINVPTTVTSSTSITFTVPTTGLTVNAQYYPVVSLPSSFGVPSSQPYNEPADLFTFT